MTRVTNPVPARTGQLPTPAPAPAPARTESTTRTPAAGTNTPALPNQQATTGQRKVLGESKGISTAALLANSNGHTLDIRAATSAPAPAPAPAPVSYTHLTLPTNREV